MHSTVLRLVAVVLALSTTCEFAAQEVITDFGPWLSLGMEKQVNKRLELDLYQELRMDENGQRVGRTFTQVGADYEATAWVDLGLNYRFLIDANGEGTYGNRHRMMIDVELHRRFQQLQLSYRSRWQYELRTRRNNPEHASLAGTTDMRSTLTLEYTYNRRLEYYAELDFQFLLRDPYTPNLVGLERLRIVAGTEVQLSEASEIDCFLLLQQDVNRVAPVRDHVVGLAYTYTL